MSAKASLIIECLNRMGCDAMGIGDDDLTLGKEFLLELAKKAKFPFLSSNIVDEESGKLLFQPYLVKEVNGLRIGIFSVLSPDFFVNPADPKKKGLSFRSPTDVVGEMIKELQPKTDLIILLSHLGYPKDMELAQAVSGISIIAGGHTGMHLAYPPVIKNTILLQTGSKGMYGARLDLTLHNNNSIPYHTKTKWALENNLNILKNRLNSPQASEAEKAQLRKSKEEVERKLREIQGKNEFTNNISPLTEAVRDAPDILRIIEEYKVKFHEPTAPPPVK